MQQQGKASLHPGIKAWHRGAAVAAPKQEKQPMESRNASPLWTPGPAPGLGARPNIVKVEPGRTLTLVCLSSRCEGAIVHWDGRRTVACTGDDTCPVDHAKTKRRWQGWLAVQQVNGNELLYLPVTEGAAKDRPEVTDPLMDLRGREIRVWRANQHANAELAIAFGITLYRTDRLMVAPDLREFCRRLWGFSPRNERFQARQTGQRPEPVNSVDQAAFEAFEQSAQPANDGQPAGQAVTPNAELNKGVIIGRCGSEEQKGSKKTGKNKRVTQEQIRRLKGGNQ